MDAYDYVDQERKARKEDPPPERHNRNLRGEERDRWTNWLRARYEGDEDTTVESLSLDTGLSTYMIRLLLKEAGVTMRKRQGAKKSRNPLSGPGKQVQSRPAVENSARIVNPVVARRFR